MLVIAVYRGDIDLCRHLLKWNFDLDKDVDRMSQSPLGAAMKGEHLDVLQLLLRRGADPHHVWTAAFLYSFRVACGG